MGCLEQLPPPVRPFGSHVRISLTSLNNTKLVHFSVCYCCIESELLLIYHLSILVSRMVLLGPKSTSSKILPI